MVLLLLVVPVQLAWAAAAPYCGHETGSAVTKHFGHHEHRHQADAPVSSSQGDGVGPSGAYHADCETCHLGASVTLPVPALAIAVLFTPPLCGDPPTRYLSHIPSGPERPDRLELAAAARSAGGVEFGLHIA